MPRSYVDSSELVPAVMAQHPHHDSALARPQAPAQEDERGYTSAHGITEFYSVMTRAPFRPPLHATEVWRLIDEVILKPLELVTLTAREHLEVTRRCDAAGWGGGRIHDAIHLQCAEKAGCHRIYTFNAKDFRALATPETLSRIITP